MLGWQTAQQSIDFHAAAPFYRQPLVLVDVETQRLLAAGQLKGLVFLHFCADAELRIYP
jgi:hypothetical protein